MKDYNNIPFKNASIDRLTSRTTNPPGMRSMKEDAAQAKRTEWQKNIPKPFVQGAQEQSSYTPKVESKKVMVYPKTNGEASGRYDGLKKKSTGLEYEPKVRKRQMKP
jgi:hypothetical protein